MRFFRPSMPEWTPVKIAVTGVLLIGLALVIQTIYPQSTRDFEAPTLRAGEFEFSNMKLAAYNGMRYSVREPRRSNRSGRSITGGVLIEGTIENTSDRELLLTTGYLGDEIIRSNPIGATLSITNNARLHRTEVEIKATTYSLTNDGVTGYFIKPNEQFNFKLLTSSLEIEAGETTELEIAWLILDPETLKRFSIFAIPNFERSGSSLVWWVESEIFWKRDLPVRR